MDSPPEFRGAASRLAARVTGSRFAVLVARAALVAAAVGLLAIIGYAAGPRALASSAVPATAGSAAAEPRPGDRLGPEAALPSASPPALGPPLATPPPSPPPPARVAPEGVAPEGARTEASPATAGRSARTMASPDDPVVLNAATIDDLRRLPGIGEKRAAAMIALRERLGRFRAVEDLLKVKGIGRAMLRRIRPLVRLDARLEPKAGVDGGAN
jgi:competence protein ComEA